MPNVTIEEKLLKTAAVELGVQRIPGPEHNARILQYADEAGLGWINDDETPWCAIFMNWLARQCNAQRSGRASARSFLEVGTAVQTAAAEPGHVAVLWRGTRNGHLGHVGLFLGYSLSSNRIWLLGGNQDGGVSINAFNADRLLGIRKLAPVS